MSATKNSILPDNDYGTQGGPTCSVLVVDDEPDIVRGLGIRLRKAGYEVFEAHDAKSAWELLQRLPVDIIICDVIMPDVSGLAFCSRVKQDERFRHCYFTLLTAKGGTNDRAAGLNTGADDYIAKPFDARELLARVRAGARIVESRKRVDKESITDSLTGLYAKPMLWTFLGKELSCAQLYGSKLSLLVIGIDCFKQLNDTYGCLAGDQVLSRIGELIRGRLGENDVAGCLAGNKFVLLLPETDIQRAEILGQEVCTLVRDSSIRNENKPLSVTVSIGVTSLVGNQEAKIIPETLFGQADAAMRRAEQDGGNCVFIAEECKADISALSDNSGG